MQEQQDDRVVLIPKQPNSFLLSPHRAFYAKGGNILYCMEPHEDLEIPGLRNVFVHDYLISLLHFAAVRELNQLLEQKAGDTAMYRTERFWRNALNYAGRTVVPGSGCVYPHNVAKGIVNVSVFGDFGRDDRIGCTYNIVDRTFSFCWNHTQYAQPPTAADFVYGDLVEIALAQRQLDDGIMPGAVREAYEELIRMHEWLDGKRSVHAEFRSGDKLQIRPFDIVTAGVLLDMRGGQFLPRHYSYLLPVDDALGVPVKLHHYTRVHRINTMVFSRLDIVPETPQSKEQETIERQYAAIAKLLADSGACYSYYRIRMWGDDSGLQGDGASEYYTIDASDTPEKLMDISAVKDFLQYHYAVPNLRASVTRYTIGEGAMPVEMPEELFAAMQSLPVRLWRELPHFQEHGTAEIPFDIHFLYNRLYQHDHPSIHTRNDNLLSRKIFASVPENTVYRITFVNFDCRRDWHYEVFSGHPPMEELESLVQNSRQEWADVTLRENRRVDYRYFGSGTHFEDTPDELMELIRKYQAQYFVRHKAVVSKSELKEEAEHEY